MCSCEPGQGCVLNCHADFLQALLPHDQCQLPSAGKVLTDIASYPGNKSLQAPSSKSRLRCSLTVHLLSSMAEEAPLPRYAAHPDRSAIRSMTNFSH